MKKSFLVIIMIFSLQIVTAAFADTEYDTALKDYYRGNYKDAVIRLKAYVEKKPYPAAYYLIGYSLYKLGRFRESVENFNEAYLIDPNFSPEKSGIGEKLPAVKGKAKAYRKKASRHAHAGHEQAPKEKQRATEKKVPSSSASKTGQKGPGKK